MVSIAATLTIIASITVILGNLGRFLVWCDETYDKYCNEDERWESLFAKHETKWYGRMYRRWLGIKGWWHYYW